MDPRAEEILDFWLGQLGPSRWYDVDPALDAEIATRFGGLWEEGLNGGLNGWLTQPQPTLACVILLDQFPRNMFRGSAQAFSSDRRALAMTKSAIARGLDELVGLPERQFFYLPLMHSELLADQDRCVRLFALSFGMGDSLHHARAHREIIRRFGRFPYRNAALGRTSTRSELAFLESGGYQAMLAELSAPA
jgi:uncharacterized protein (DUF924 family)